MADVKALMKERMAAVKAKEKEKIAQNLRKHHLSPAEDVIALTASSLLQMKALKASQAPVPTPAPVTKPVSMPPPKPKDPVPPAAADKSALPQGFFDKPSGGAVPEQAPAQKRADVDKPKPTPAAAVAPPPREQPTGGVVDLGLAYGSSDEDDESSGDEGGGGAGVEEPVKAVGALPDGFFDDKVKDAIAHNREAPKKMDMDEMMAEFENDLEKDVEALDRYEDEEVKKKVDAREKEEREEAEDMAARVMELRQAKMELLNKRKVEAGAAGSKKRKFNFDDDDDEDDSDDDDEADDLLDWRRKAA